MKDEVYAGMHLDKETLQRISEAYPEWRFSVTRGRHYPLDEGRQYLVRCGKDAVIMPHMKYSDGVISALENLLKKENEIG